MRKLALFAGLILILAVIGCESDPVLSPAVPDSDTEGRIVGTIQGTVTDGSNQALLEGVEVTTTSSDAHISTLTDATGHYAFTNLDPGHYVLTFVFPETDGETKAVYDHYAVGRMEEYVITLDELTEDDLSHDGDFYYEVDGSIDLYPLIGGATGRVYKVENDWSTVFAANVAVVADFDGSTIVDQEFYGTTDANGIYTFANLPAGLDGYVRTVPFHDGTHGYSEESEYLELRTVNFATPDDIYVYVSTGTDDILANNFNDRGVAPTANLEITFANDQVIDSYEFELRVNGSVWPVTPTWTGLTMVSLDPVADMPEGASCYLYMNGYRFDFWTTGGDVPFVVSNNFEDIPFPLEGNLVFGFSEPMDASTFVVELEYGNLTIDLSWNAAFTELTVDPELPLEDDDSYRITVEGKNAEGVSLDEDAFYFNTVINQRIVIVAHNMEDNFPVAGNLEMTFSEVMDTASFDGNIYLTMNGDNQGFIASWTDGLTLSINPAVDFDLGSNVELYVEGLSSADALEFSDDWDFDVFEPAEVFVESHTIVDGEFGLLDNMTFVFSDAMDQDDFEFLLYSSETDDPNLDDYITGSIVWNNAFSMTFDPALTLLAAEGYTIGINATTLEGGVLDGGRDHVNIIDNDNYNYQFTTIGQLGVVSHNMYFEDGSWEGFPLDGTIEVVFTADLDLSANETQVVLISVNMPESGDETPVLMDYTAAGNVLSVVPDQPLTGDSDYLLYVNVFSTVTGISYEGEFEFTTYSAPDGPTEVVTGFVHDAEADDWATLGDYTMTDVNVSWAWQPNAEFYVVYARLADMAKMDYYAVLQVANPSLEPADGLVDGAIDLTTGPGGEDWTLVFDSRCNDAGVCSDYDNIQSPFEGTNMLFKVTAYNDLGESDSDIVLTLGDEVLPDGTEFGVTTQDGSADANSDGEGGTFDVTFIADEYIDHASVPVVTVTEGGAGTPSPDYAVSVYTVAFADNHLGQTEITLTFTVDANENGAGDEITINGLMDTSGNVQTVESAAFTTLDTTIPTGVLATQVGSADNTEDAGDETFSIEFTSSEILSDGTAPTISVFEDDGVTPVVTTTAVDTWTDDDAGFTTVVLDITVGSGLNFHDYVIMVTGFADLSGNVMTDEVTMVVADTSGPFMDVAAQDQTADNSAAPGHEISVTVSFTFKEDVDKTDIIDAGDITITQAVPGVGAVFWGSRWALDGSDTYEVLVKIPDGEDGTDDVVEIEGLFVDLLGNVSTDTFTHTLN